MKKKGIARVEIDIPRKQVPELRNLIKSMHLKLKEVEYDDEEGSAKRYFKLSQAEKQMISELFGRVPDTDNPDALYFVIPWIRAMKGVIPVEYRESIIAEGKELINNNT